MNHLLKRTLSIWLCALLLLAVQPITAAAENYSGKLGDYISWTYNDIRHDLQIYGNGPMEDYDRTPFFGRRTEITKVIISGGVTYIGANAFNPLSKVTSIKIESGVQAVGKNAFSGTNASSIILPDSVRSIGDGALTCCTAAVHIPRFTQDIGENILNLHSTTVYICSTTEDCYAKEYADANGYTFKLCTHAEHTHNYTAVETTATCTQGGFTTHTCTVCGDSYTSDKTDALGHSFGEWTVTTDPTCTAQGEETRTCSRCETTETQPINAAGHTYNAVETTATCTQGGFTTHTCTVCGDSYTSDETDALGHNFGEWSVTTDPTCTETGEETRTCSRCGETETQPVDAAGHTYNAVVTTATCTEAGRTTYTCSVCGDTYTDDETDALGHDFGEWQVTTDPTCTAAGEKTRTCSRCSETETQPVEAAGHTYNAVVTTATCTEAGRTTYTCSVCGDSYTTDETDALGHDFGEWQVTTDPTCTAAGEKTRTCSRCSETETQPVEAAGHTYNAVVTTATCTEAGRTTYTCSVCGDSYTTDETDALGHDFGEWQVTTDPTCTAAGEKTRTCSRCSETETQPVEAAGHTYDAVVTTATCTADGFTTYTCSVCGERYTGMPVPAAGHQYSDEVVLPTCTQTGCTVHTCTVCGEHYSDTVVSALGHDWREKSRTNAACTSDGEIVFVCSRDASHTRTQTLPALGHTYIQTVTPPTCTKDGFTTHTCAVCGESFSDTVVPASGHRYDAAVVAPTCTKDGYTVYTCTVCGKSYTGMMMPALGHQPEDGICTRCGLAVDWEFTTANGSVTLTKYTADEPYVTVPGTLGGSSVTAIADGAFRDNGTVEYVCIPDSVRSIGREAFFGCEQLREVFVGRGVQTVGFHAFAQCPCLAIFCTLAQNVDLRGNVFGMNDPRLTCTVPADSKTATFLERSALPFRTFSYPVMRDDQYVIAFSGETVLYGDLEYFYWSRLVHLYPDVTYLRFDKLAFDGISPDFVGDEFDESFVDGNAECLTFNNVYVSVQVQDETITFERLAELLESGQVSLALSFDSEKGERLTIFQRIGGVMHRVFNALTKLLNSIIRIFKKK